MKNIAILGAGFGDEGKGLATDYCAKLFKGDCTVVRFNGSGQCGHNVMTPRGDSHVFSHLGAGSLTGAHTYFSQYTAVSPMIFHKEALDFIHKFYALPYINVSFNAIVITPYDVLINQIIETVRDNKHGSCGLGFGETVERCTNYEFNTTYHDFLSLNDYNEFYQEMLIIKDVWVPKRLKAYGIEVIPVEFNEILNSDKVIENFYSDWLFFKSRINQLNYKSNSIRQNIIFEGGQGLLLDQDSKFFPHVTRSKTGLHNVEFLCNEFGIKDLNLIFVTR